MNFSDDGKTITCTHTESSTKYLRLFLIVHYSCCFGLCDVIYHHDGKKYPCPRGNRVDVSATSQTSEISFGKFETFRPLCMAVVVIPIFRYLPVFTAVFRGLACT